MSNIKRPDMLGDKNPAKRPESRIKISNFFKGRPSGRKGIKLSKEHAINISKGLKGIKFTEEHKKKLSIIRSKKLGEKSSNWKGGLYHWWRKQVLERDNYTCRICQLKDEEIMQADHIKPQSKYPELKLDINNGQTLCPNCHERKSIKEKNSHIIND